MYAADPAVVPAAEVVAPPTFAACFCLGRSVELFTDPVLGAHPNLVHGGQEFEFHRPVRVGDVLECTPVITDITARRGMELLTYAVEVVDAHDGEPVLTARSTIIFFDEEAS